MQRPAYIQRQLLRALIKAASRGTIDSVSDQVDLLKWADRARTVTVGDFKGCPLGQALGTWPDDYATFGSAFDGAMIELNYDIFIPIPVVD